MKILVIASGWETEIVGGIRTYLDAILPRLKQRGHSLLVISSSQKQRGLGMRHGIPVRDIKYSGGWSTFITVPKKLLWVLWYLITFRPDVVFCQKAVNAIYTPLFRLVGVRTVCHPHGMKLFVKLIGGELTYYRKKNFAKYLILKLAGVAEWFGLKSCDAVIAFSNFHARLIKVPKKKITVIPNGVDVSRWGSFNGVEQFKQKYGLSGFVIGFCGRIYAEKGIDQLIVACSKLPFNYTLCLVGDFPVQPKEYWLNLATQCGVKLVLTDRIKDEELPLAYHSFDVYTQLTAPQYGFEIAILEAMASRVPVISTKAEERDELFNGHYVPCVWGSTESIKRALAHVYEMTQPEKDLLTSSAWDFVKARYCWEAIAERTEKALIADSSH